MHVCCVCVCVCVRKGGLTFSKKESSQLLCEKNIKTSFLAYRYKPSQRLQLTASRSTRYEEILMLPDQLRMSYTPRHCTAIAAISHVKLAWGEFDTVGIVVCITTANIPGTER